MSIITLICKANSHVSKEASLEACPHLHQNRHPGSRAGCGLEIIIYTDLRRRQLEQQKMRFICIRTASENRSNTLMCTLQI